MKSGVRPQFTLALLAAAACASAPAHAQVTAYGEVTVSKLTIVTTGTNTTSILAGPTLGLTGDFAKVHGVAIGADLRGSFLGAGMRLDQAVVGPTFGLKYREFRPYAEFLVGFGRFNDGKGQASSSSTDSEIQVIAGLDLPLKGRFGVRVFEYTYEQYYGLGGAYNPKSFSSGVTYTLGAR